MPAIGHTLRPSRWNIIIGTPFAWQGVNKQPKKASPRGHGGMHSVPERWRLGRLCPPYEAVNLSHFTVPDMSQIKDLRPLETSKIEKIHILYDLRQFHRDPL
jgi:hypothetical protein